MGTPDHGSRIQMMSLSRGPALNRGNGGLAFDFTHHPEWLELERQWR
jgi:hypothetical protein